MRNIIVLYIILGFIAKCFSETERIPLVNKKEFVFAPKKNVKADSRDEYENIRGQVSFKYGQNSEVEYWDIYRSLDNQIEINLPENCTIIQDSCCVLYCTQEAYYFSIIAHDRTESKINKSLYLQYIINLMRQDPNEKVIDYSFESSEDEKIYLAYYTTLKNSSKYNIFSCITQDQNNVYDITLKVKDTEIPEIQSQKFYKVIRSLVINGKKLISIDGIKSYDFDIGFENQQQN